MQAAEFGDLLEAECGIVDDHAAVSGAHDAAGHG